MVSGSRLTCNDTLSWGTNLYMHLNDGFPNQSRAKEGPEGDQEMATSYSRQVEQRIWDLKHKQNTNIWWKKKRRCLSETCRDVTRNKLTEAHARIPKNPTFCTMCWTPSFSLVTKSWTDRTKRKRTLHDYSQAQQVGAFFIQIFDFCDTRLVKCFTHSATRL